MAVGENENIEVAEDEHVPPYNPNHRFSIAFKRASFQAPEEIWNMFAEAEECCDIIDYFNALVRVLNIDSNVHGLELYEILRSKLTSWKCQSLWDLLNARLKHAEYKHGTVAKDKTCIIIGAGPIGLRTAIECLMLGCKTIIVEKRDKFSRNNVLHLWPFLMTDFRNLGAKKFCGKFGAGCIEHINIRTLQCILLKVALLLGAEVYIGVCFKDLVEPIDENTGWRAMFEPENHVLSKTEFNIVIGADGKKNILPGFEQIELRGALAIGITCNFVNNNTIEEARVNEISGISFQYNQNFFIQMEEKYGVRLENIVYYKDETHYFVMTALKNSLLKLKVLKEDFGDPSKLITSSNIDNQRLKDFARSAVHFATDHQLPEDIEFKLLSNGQPDIALFDFTSLKKASNASRIIERHKKKLLLTLVGDSLIEPFWPTGSGAGRGVLSALDCAWMIKQYCSNHPPLACVRERENIYKLLSGTTNESLKKNHKLFTIDPTTRYTAFDSKKVSNISSLHSLYDTDDKDADFSVMSPQQNEKDTTFVKRRRRSSSGGGRKKSTHSHVTSTHVHPHGQNPSTTKHTRRGSPTKEKKNQDVVGTKKFWEEHNKKNIEKQAKQHVPKIKTPSIDEDIDMEGWSEIEDEVIADDTKISARSTQSTKSSKSKLEASGSHKENFLKRQKGNHIFKRQKSKEPLSPTKSKSTSKAKTPDPDLKTKKSTSLKKENTAKRKISMKQDPARYDNFLKTSSSYQRRVASKETSGSNKSLSGSSIGPSEKRLRSSTRVTSSASNSKLLNQKSTSIRRTPSVNSSPAGKRVTKSSTRRVTATKRNTSVNRSTTVSKVRRKSSVRKIGNNESTTTITTTTTISTGEKMLTRSSFSDLSNKSVERLPQVKKAKKLKRSIGRTSLEGKASLNKQSVSPNQSTESEPKRPRISSLPAPSISVTSPEKQVSSDGVPMSPSPFIFETSSLSEKVGNRLCPLGKRSRLPQSSGMVGRFLRDHRAASISVCSPVREEEGDESDNIFQDPQQLPQPLLNLTDNSARRVLAAGRKLRRQSNFKLVRLNSVKNKRKSMLRTVAKSKKI